MTTPRVPEKARPAFPVWVFGLVGCIVLLPMVVAVVGILAAIAIPNFLKYQCKAKQSEAKANLAGLYTAEKAFYGEYGFYTTDLKALNWEPIGTPLYLYGFAEAGPDRLPDGAQPPADYDPSRKDTSDPGALTGGYSTAKMRDLTGYPLDPVDVPAQAVVAEDGSGFVVAAIGDIDTDARVTLDVWTMDQDRYLTASNNDCIF